MSAPRIEDAGNGPAGKIGPHHRDRLAVVYIRQSTAYQVVHHQESTRLQYALQQRAVELGWAPERVVVIDDDLGLSGASAEGRVGFQRLMAEVGMDHVGIILGVETSRLARSCRDWYHLLEVCALFMTLISDTDGVYDPCNYNDRLLLGLKGTMSEAELHILRQRLLAGMRAKARRGELTIALPAGYIRKPSGEVSKDPDEQAQTIVALLFEQFMRRGTVTGVLAYLATHDIKLPMRAYSGPSKGELRWSRPSRTTLQNIFTNPTYAGAYVYGRRRRQPYRSEAGGPLATVDGAVRGRWEVCLRDRLPAYISWDQFEANQKQLQANRSNRRGVVRRGDALLSGLLVCGRCRHRMSVAYSGRHRYICAYELASYGGELCQSVTGRVVDKVVVEWVLRALEPASLEISLAAAAELEHERAQLTKTWQQRLDRAKYEVERSRREYDLVEPENRLVKRTLERELEERLASQQNLQEEYHRYLGTHQKAVLNEQEREAIRRLATDLPCLWNAATTTIQQKQTIVRQLVERIQLTVVGETERVLLTIEWVGGHRTDTELVRPVGRVDQLSYYDKLLDRIRTLHEACNPFTRIAAQLNDEGWRPAKRRQVFNRTMVASLLSRINQKTKPRAHRVKPQLRPHEWTIAALASELAMPSITIYGWIRRQWIIARKVLGIGTKSFWVIRADGAEIERLRALRLDPIAHGSGRRPRASSV
jgi:DNA invertase Pin-like site-specific DNA recombinase